MVMCVRAGQAVVEVVLEEEGEKRGEAGRKWRGELRPAKKKAPVNS
jgi:hypothetical protein